MKDTTGIPFYLSEVAVVVMTLQSAQFCFWFYAPGQSQHDLAAWALTHEYRFFT